MRLMFACLAVLPAAAHADSFTLSSQPTDVTIFAAEAEVTRTLTAEVPAGTHDLVLPGLPKGLSPDRLRVAVTGAALTATQFRATAVPPQPDSDTAAVAAARERVKEAERQIRILDDRVEETRLASGAAEARVAFLADLGRNEGLPGEIASLRELARMIEEETLSAKQAALAAEQTARDLAEGRTDLEKELKAARAALAALTPPAKQGAQLTLTVRAESPGDVAVRVSYDAQASWTPVYDVMLAGEDPAIVTLRRGALISQNSGENWQDVSVTLSTLQPSLQITPSEIWPQPRRFEDPEQPRPFATSRMTKESADAIALIEDAPVMVEPVVIADTEGPGVRYQVSAPLTLASGVDAARVALDTLDFEARRFARAAPRHDSTAFLMAEFTNTGAEPLLTSGDAAYYVDNTLVGRGFFDAVPAGDEGRVAFGPIEELQLSYTVLDETEADRGLITRSNAMSEARRLDVENLGSEAWVVEMQDVVPYAVQEDLDIDWSATPDPDLVDVEDKRGVLQWTLEVPAGDTASITIEQELRWPEGKVLR